MERLRRLFTVMVVLGPLLGCAPGEDVVAGEPPDGGGPTTEPDGGAPAPSEPVLRVAFKLDRRLTDGLYMGDRWVSPPTYQALPQTTPTFTAEARIEPAPSGTSAAVAWTPSDPEGVAVAPATADGHEVVITVTRPGASTLTVSSGEDETVVEIEAQLDSGTWHVTFRQ